MIGFEWILLLIFLIAALYGSVGHGGASGYLAVLSLLMVNHQVTSSTALILNLFVAGIAFWSYFRVGAFSWRLTVPFVLASVPMAFLGGFLKTSTPVYDLLLALALFGSVVRLLLPGFQQFKADEIRPVSHLVALMTGGVLGFLSGLVGVGGGIFLSPIMILCRWASPKTTSATAAAFILVNSLAGLCGRFAHHNLVVDGFWPLVAAGVLGGLLGSGYGARWASNPMLCRLLALVMLIAAGKMILQVF